MNIARGAVIALLIETEAVILITLVLHWFG